MEVLITLGCFKKTFEDSGRTTEILHLGSLPNLLLLMGKVQVSGEKNPETKLK